MNKELERWLIVILVLMLVGAGMSGCVKPQVAQEQPKQSTTIDTIGRLDAIANELGCMFDPTPCQKKAQEQKPHKD